MRSHEGVNKSNRYYVPYSSSLLVFGDTPTNEGEPLDMGSRERVFAILPRGDIANDSWVIICVLPQAKRINLICTHNPSVRFNPFTENVWGRRLNFFRKRVKFGTLAGKGCDFGVQNRASP